MHAKFKVDVEQIEGGDRGWGLWRMEMDANLKWTRICFAPSGVGSSPEELDDLEPRLNFRVCRLAPLLRG